MQRTRTERAMRNILLSLFFFIKKDNVILVQDSHSNKEKTLICNIFWIIHRISKKFVQGIAGKKKHDSCFCWACEFYKHKAW